MATEVLMPKLGFSMTEGELKEWTVAEGGDVTEGQILYLLESEKSVTEVEAPASGVLRIHKPAGDVYQVGTVLGLIE